MKSLYCFVGIFYIICALQVHQCNGYRLQDVVSAAINYGSSNSDSNDEGEIESVTAKPDNSCVPRINSLEDFVMGLFKYLIEGKKQLLLSYIEDFIANHPFFKGSQRDE